VAAGGRCRLSIEPPTTLELVLDARAARAPGVTYPESLLVRVDRVAE
jgi:hypothetical protein